MNALTDCIMDTWSVFSGSVFSRRCWQTCNRRSVPPHEDRRHRHSIDALGYWTKVPRFGAARGGFNAVL